MKKIAPDKWKHFYVGLLMGVLLQAFFRWLIPQHLLLTTGITFAFVVGISYGFELFSRFTGKGHYEVLDAVAAVIGGVLGMAAVVVFQLHLF